MTTQKKAEGEKVRAENILELVRHHKYHCIGKECTISTYMLLEDFERHMGRKATPEEVIEFI